MLYAIHIAWEGAMRETGLERERREKTIADKIVQNLAFSV